MFFPLLCAVPGKDAASFWEVPATFARNLVYVSALDDAGNPHTLLVDSGSPTTFLRTPSSQADGTVSLTLASGPRKFRIRASTVAGSVKDGRSEGLLGLDFLQHHAIAIDYEKGRLWLGKPKGGAAKSFLTRYAASPSVRSIPLRRLEGGYYGIDLALNGFRCESVLDTGSEGFSLFADRGEGWRLDPVGEKEIVIHSGKTTAKEFLARTVKVGGLTLHAQPVTCLSPSAIFFEPWMVDSLVSTSVFPSKLTMVDFPNRRLTYVPSVSAGHSALLRHLLIAPVRREGAQFRLKGYFVDLPPVLAFQDLPVDPSRKTPGMNVMGRDGTLRFRPAQRGATLTKVSGRPVGSLLRRNREAQSGSPSAYANLLAIYRSQRRQAECTLIIAGRSATYRGSPLPFVPAP